MAESEQSVYAAFDLGAESGRVILGHLSSGQLVLEELHRFQNGPITIGGSLHWDVDHLWAEIKQGLRLAIEKAGTDLRSMSVDTWGVDFGLLDKQGELIETPYHYRDARTNGMLEAAFETVSREEIYAETGIQFMQLNTLFQLLAMVKADLPALAKAYTLLNMPDLFNFLLTGRKVNEFSIVTTTQCYNPTTRQWATDMLAELGIPVSIFGEISPSGTVLGSLQSIVLSEVGDTDLAVIAGAGHDTACAVAAVPASSPDFMYISSGTWSLMGIESDEPIISSNSLSADMTNEGGVGGKIRFLKNIMGLWLVQECRRLWVDEDEVHSYAELTEMAGEAASLRSFINPGDGRFLAPDNMPEAIQSFCNDTGQPIPQSKGEIIRCALESLALEYRSVAENIDKLSGKYYPVVHIVGGGTQNKLLNQLAANATQREVIAGPVEATAVGNVLVQAMALGDIATLEEGRALVRDSFAVETYLPRDMPAWDEAYRTYKSFKKVKESA